MLLSDLQIAMSRRDKNEYFLSVAKTIAFGSKCPEGKQHGAIAVRGQRMISTGYNGPAAGVTHCGNPCPLDKFKQENNGAKNFALCPAVHAEINVIVTAARFGTALEDAIFYVTKRPCDKCHTVLKNLGLAGVVFPQDEEEDTGVHFLILGPELNQIIELEY